MPTYTRSVVREELWLILRKHVPQEASLAPETTIAGDLALDSLAVMEIVADVEDRFRIPMPDDTLPELRTIGDVEDALVGYLAARGRLDE